MPREPVLRNTCHGPRTSLPQRVFHPTDHVQQDIHPTGNQSPSARKSGAVEARRRVGRRRGRLPSSARQSLHALVMQSSAPAPGAPSPWDSALGATKDSISQCTFLQMTYTAENPHADGSAAPGARPRYRPPRHRDLPATSRTHDNWMAARQTSCRQQTAPPQPRCSKDVTAHPHRPGARPGRPCPVPACSGQPPPGRSGFRSPLRNSQPSCFYRGREPKIGAGGGWNYCVFTKGTPLLTSARAQGMRTCG